MKPSSLDSWVIARLLSGSSVNGESEDVSTSLKGLVANMAGLPFEDRRKTLDGFCCHPGFDGEALLRAIDDADPSQPAPEVVAEAAYATLADYARIASDQHWLWDGWIARGVLNVVASEPGTGKTRFVLDLARRFYFGMSLPDGRTSGLPGGTRTLWVQADRAFPEMLQAARAFGLPDEAVTLGSAPDDPTGSLDLDDPETLDALAGRIRAARPALVIIDTVMMVTSRNLCRPEEARAFFAPIMELAASSGVAFLALTHLSKEKEALGRRIVEKARVVIKMTKPDPEGQPNRRKLWVDKTAAVNPPALGITMGDSGNEYDFNPPVEVEVKKSGGRPPEMLTKAISFLTEQLRDGDCKQVDLVQGWDILKGSKGTIFAAFRVMQDDGRLVIDDNVRPKICHLVENSDEGQELSS